MREEILINPENKWLAASGSGDIANYGAPADPTMLIRQAPDPDSCPGSSDTPPQAPIAVDAAGLDGYSGKQDPSPFADATPSDSGQSATAAAMLAPTLFQPLQAPLVDHGATQGLQPFTTFAGRPVVSENPLPAADPGSATPEATLPALTPPLLDLADGAAIAPGAIVASLPGVGDVVDIVPDVGAPLFDLSAADDIGTNFQDLLGSDPAGGIATLVSLVSAVDILDLRDAGNADGLVETALPAEAMVDMLAADDHVDPLLAETADDDGPLPGVDDGLADAASSLSPVDPLADDLSDGLG